MSDTPTTKVCTKCGEEKGLDCFHKNKSQRLGISVWCKACNKIWHATSPTAIAAHERARQKRANNPKLAMIIPAKARSRKFNVPFDITENDIDIPCVCPVLGIEIKKNAGGAGGVSTSTSLDRVIPKNGYTRGNICVISHRANTLKSSATAIESAQIALYQARRQQAYIDHLESELERLKKAQ